MLLSKEQFLTLKKRLEELERLFTEQRALAKQKKKSEVEKKGESDRCVENELIAVHLKLSLHYLARYQEESLIRLSQWKDKYYIAAEEHLRIATLEQGIEIANNNAFINLIQLYLEAREYENALKWINLCSEKLSSSAQKTPLVLLSKLLIELLSQEQLLHTKAAANNASARAEQNIPANAVAIKMSEIMAAFFKTTADVYLPPMPWCIALLKGHLVQLLLNELHRTESPVINVLVLTLCNFYFVVGQNKKVHFWIEQFETVLNFQEETSFLFVQDLMANAIAEGNLSVAQQLGVNYRTHINELRTGKIDRHILRSLSCGANLDAPTVNKLSQQGTPQSAPQNRVSIEAHELKPPTATIPTLTVAQASSGNSNLSDKPFLSPMKIFTSIAAPIASFFAGNPKQLEPIPELKLKAIPCPSFLEALTILEHVMNMNNNIGEGIAVDEYRDDFNAFCANEFAGVKYLIEACTPALYLTLLSQIIDTVLRFENLKNHTGLLGALYYKIAEIQYSFYPYENQAQRLSDCVENYILAFEHGLYVIEDDKPVCAKTKTAYIKEQIHLCLSALPLLTNPALAPNQIMGNARRSNLLVAWYIDNRLANDCRPARVAFMAATGVVPADFHVQLAAYDSEKFNAAWLDTCNKELERVNYTKNRLAVDIIEYFDCSWDTDCSLRIFLIDEMRAVISDSSFIHPCDDFLDILEYAIRNNRRNDIKKLFSKTIYELINNHLAKIINVILLNSEQNSRSKEMDEVWDIIGRGDPRFHDEIEEKLLKHFFVVFAQQANEPGLAAIYNLITEKCKKTLEKFARLRSAAARTEAERKALSLYNAEINDVIGDFHAISIQATCLAWEKLAKGIQSAICGGIARQPSVAAERLVMIDLLIKLVHSSQLYNIDIRTELTVDLIRKIILNNDTEFLRWLFLTLNGYRKIPHAFFVRLKQQELYYSNPLGRTQHREVLTVTDKDLDYQAYRDFYQSYASVRDKDAFIFDIAVDHYIDLMRHHRTSSDYAHAADTVLRFLVGYYRKAKCVYYEADCYVVNEYFVLKMVKLFDVASEFFREMIHNIFKLAKHESNLIPLESGEDSYIGLAEDELPSDSYGVIKLQSNQKILTLTQSQTDSIVAVFQVNPNSDGNTKLCRLLCSSDADFYINLIIHLQRMQVSAEDQLRMLEWMMVSEIKKSSISNETLLLFLEQAALSNIFKAYLQKKKYECAVRMLTINYRLNNTAPVSAMFMRNNSQSLLGNSDVGELFLSLLNKLSIDDVHAMQLVQPRFFNFWVRRGLSCLEEALNRNDIDLVKCLAQAHTAERLSAAYEAIPQKKCVNFCGNREFLIWYINTGAQEAEQFEKIISNPKNELLFKDLVKINKITVELMSDILKWPLVPVETSPDTSSNIQLKSR